MARRRPRVEIDQTGIAELLQSPGVRADLERRARNVLDEARDTAPVDTGEHRDSLHIETGTTDRATVRVVADSDHSMLVEATTGHLARSLDAASD